MPSTSAWPPRRPSVPTSRATRVTSSANEDSWSTIVLIVFFSSAISPFTSTVTFLERSPFATAVVTSAMLRTCSVRDVAMKFTFSVRPRHTPLTPSTCAWPPSLPSVPTSLAPRVPSAQNPRRWSDGDGDLLAEVAVRDGGRDLRDVAHLVGQVAGERVDVVGQVLPHAADALDVRLAAELALGTDLLRDARHLGRERAQLVDHR